MRLGVQLAARVCQEEAGAGGRRFHVAMQTLTYAPGEEWSRWDISRYRAAVVAHFARRSVVVRCVWVAEVQVRGAVHYHALWWLPSGVRIPKADSRGWWRKGHSNTKGVRSAVGYVSKGVSYVSKGTSLEEVELPKGLRIHGASGLSGGGRQWRAWQRLPAFVRVAWPDPRATARRLCGEEIRNNGPGFVDEGTGEVLPSPWRVVSIAGGVVRLALAFACREDGSVDLAGMQRWELQAFKFAENVVELVQGVGDATDVDGRAGVRVVLGSGGVGTGGASVAGVLVE